MKPPIPDNEAARLEALHQYKILDTEPDESLNDLTRLAAFICGTPIALISLIDLKRQWFKARLGISETETTRDVSFCAHAIMQDGPLVVRDALDDERFQSNPLVTSEPRIRFYAGSPLITPEGFKLGTLCVVDRVPHDLNPEQVAALRMLANQVIIQLDNRRELAFMTQALEECKRREAELKGRLNDSTA